MSTDAVHHTGLETQCRDAERAGYAVACEAWRQSGRTDPPTETSAAQSDRASAAFGLGIAAGVIDGLRDAVDPAGEGRTFAVAELAFQYMGARELVAAAAAGLSEADPECAAVAVGELLRACACECLALGDRTPELARLEQLLASSDVRALAARAEASLERTAEIVLGEPGALTAIAEDDR